MTRTASHLRNAHGHTPVVALALVFVLCVALGACANPYGTDANTGESLADRVSSGTSIQAERGSKTLDIHRAKPSGTRPAGIQENSWTVFVYLCGSDLETEGGAATADLNEMLRASGSSNVRFVVETGGAKSWRNRTVNAKKLGRYLIQGGKMTDVDGISASSMGETSTLADFITWGIRKYPADHMGLILWDHGGGSISGVCFDERNNNDSLLLREVDAALAKALPSMWDTFEFVGFDACLMSTLETANVLATYSKYMIASQESEPGTGWEYRSLVEYLATHPTCTGAQLGKQLCNDYLDSMDRTSRPYATLAVVDLAQIDQLMQDFYRFSQEMYAAGEDQGTLAAMGRGISKVGSYGSNNRREGYTNMVDLGGLVEACAEVTPSADEVLSTLNKAVVYQVRGNYHADACGLSTYYPLQISSSQELAIFNTVAVNPSYLDYVDRLAHGATYNGGTQYQQYTGGSFYEDNLWSWLFGNAYDAEEQAEDHWEYVDDHSPQSTQITFAQAPVVDDEGTYWFRFDAAGLDNATVVSGLVYEVSEDGSDLISLGETYDVYGDWDTGEFSDGFDGLWLSLPDGQNLNLTVENATDDSIVYSSPIRLNDKDCYLRISQDIEDGTVVVEGAWGAIGAGGAMDRGLTKIKRGDVIVPRYDATAVDAPEAASEYEGEPYKVGSKGLSVAYDYLPYGEYEYRFCIQDAFGDTYLTDPARFEIDEDGQIYFV